MQTIRQVFRLYTQGVSLSEISRRLLISRNTVKKYVALFRQENFTIETINEISDSELGKFLAQEEKEIPVKLKQLQELFPKMERELKKVGVSKQLLWEEYKNKYADGYQSSQFSYYFDQWKKASSVVMHFEHKAGDKLFVDYTGKKLYIADRDTGEIEPCEVFVAVLGSSQYTYVEATRTQNKEDFLTSLENTLHYFGGVPKVIVTDNLKAAVTKSHKYEPILNEAFADFVRHYGTSALPARAYKPRDKALVETSVRIVYNWIFAPLRERVFFSLTDLNTAIQAELKKYNSRHFSGRKYSRKDLFEEVEKSTLYPLANTRYEINKFAEGTVHKNSHVYLSADKHYYSVPYQLIGKKVRVIYNTLKVDVYYKQEPVATHDRCYQPNRYTTKTSHMPSAHQYVTEWNPDKFIGWAEGIGENCRLYIIRILERSKYPEQNYKSCIGVLSLSKKIGKKRLDRACKRGLEYEVFNYRIIENILEKGLDHLEEELPIDTQIPPHDNIRGKGYYQ